MKIEKSFEIDAPRDRVWDFISSPEKVGACFPGCEHVEARGENEYTAAIRVKMGPIKTVFNIDFEETERKPQEYATYRSRGEEGGRASRLKAESALRLSPVEDTRTRVDYTSEMSIVGRFGKFGAGMMKKKADSISEEFVKALRERIEGPPEPAEVPAAAEKYRLTRVQKWIVAAAGALIVFLILYFVAR